MKNIKKIILITLTFFTILPTFSQTSQDWQNVLNLVPAKIESIKREVEERNANEKAGYGRIRNAEKKAEQERIAAEKERYLKELSSHFVNIPGKNYVVMKTEVPQMLWQSVMGENPSNFKGANLPVENVSWLDCVIFCNKLSEKEGLTPCYSYDGTTDTTKWKWEQKKWSDWDYKKSEKFFKKTFNPKMSCNFNANGYRLPTEEEWEYAAKGGENYNYAGSDNIEEVAWYKKNSGDKTHEVATKKPNGYGLYDMSGNVSEWCWDVDPNDSRNRYYRGGRWYCYDNYCEVSYRGSNYAYYRYNDLGFRVVRSVQ